VYYIHFDLSFNIMDDIDITFNDSLSQFSVMVDGQEIDESIGTHGIAQMSGGNVDEIGKVDQQNFFLQRTQNCL
jgi:hypothetical protein